MAAESFRYGPITGPKTNELIVAEKLAEWQRLKALVLDRFGLCSSHSTRSLPGGPKQNAELGRTSYECRKHWWTGRIFKP